jgi:tRNA (guanine10-N2)-methyltransferase
MSFSRQTGYIPPFRPYELTHLTLDLIKLARYLLVPKGRLVFFLPTVTEEYDAIDIPVVEGMRELKWGEGSVQSFGKWSRRVSRPVCNDLDSRSPKTRLRE